MSSLRRTILRKIDNAHVERMGAGVNRRARRAKVKKEK
jgi:hypothetical protein